MQNGSKSKGLMRGIENGTLYKLLRSSIIIRCNSSHVCVGGNKDNKLPTIFGENGILCHQSLRNIREKGLRALHGKGMYDCMLDFNLCENYIYDK